MNADSIRQLARTGSVTDLQSILQKAYYNPEIGLLNSERVFQKIKKIIPTIARNKLMNFYENKKFFSNLNEFKRTIIHIFLFIIMLTNRLVGSKLI